MTLIESDCPICLQTLVHPAQLPCEHIFCFLCIKGSAFQRQRCPLCRARFSVTFFDNPKLVTIDLPSSKEECSSTSHEQHYESATASSSQTSTETSPDSAHCWFYEGRAGWWQYDERTSSELENNYLEKIPTCEITIAGHIYTIDFVNMSQKRTDNSGRKRKVKRDHVSCEKKGVAGIRLSTIMRTGSDQPTVPGTDLPPQDDHNAPATVENPMPACQSSDPTIAEITQPCPTQTVTSSRNSRSYTVRTRSHTTD